MIKKTALIFFACLAGRSLHAQVDAGLFRYPTVSQSQIAFSYANDIWIVPKEGGTAIKLISPPGVEAFPKFSPDGKTLAFTANYDGNDDVYVLPVTGGVPLRLTQYDGPDRVISWTRDGKNVLFASGRESTKSRFNQFYTIPATGGPATKLPLAYAEFGSYAPDGKSIAVTTRTQNFSNWKRYRGGMKADIHIFRFDKLTSENISAKSEAGNEFPMWHNDYIYLLSDRGTEKRMNLWRYHLTDQSFEQLTHYKDYDVHQPSIGPAEIVYEAAGKIYLLSLADNQSREVKVSITTDLAALKPYTLHAAKFVQTAAISPDGRRALVNARGEVFSLPAAKGFVKDLTRTSGVAERYPVWSPDGKSIAWWSDQSGEYELWLAAAGKEDQARKITSYGPGFRYKPHWSPDGKKIAFIDQAAKLHVLDIATGKTADIDQALFYSHNNLDGYTFSWSPDSRWLAYSRDGDNMHERVFLYDTRNNQRHQVTSGFYDCSRPVFDPEGKYLYVLTNQSFKATYSNIDNTFAYANATLIGAIPLKKEGPALVPVENDAVSLEKEDTPAAPAAGKDKKDKKKKDTPAPADAAATGIDLDGMEARLTLLPIPNGNYSRLGAVKGKLLYISYSGMIDSEEPPVLKYFDIADHKEKTIIKDPGQYELSADGEKILITGSTYGVINVAENQKIDTALPVNDMEMLVDPRQEWKQLFIDTWRMERDYFYDPHMHGLDWNSIKEKYLRLLEGARTREEVSFVINEMLGELNASHTYNIGGDYESRKRENVGYLGVDWQPEGDYYKIGRIIRGAAWNAEARSPLDEPGVNIREGDYILAVNGKPLTTAQEPYAVFQTLANKVVELTYNSRPSWEGAKTAIVKTLRSDYRLRHLAWIESNRKRIAEATNNQVGYIYVPNTGIDGQDELIRQLNGQWDKAALIIDERFNSGGQIPDRFIEMLNRQPLSFWATRDGKPMPMPSYGNFGPKVMLVNGWSGSGGDAFPDYFRRKGLGPIIGTRTWGGLIGISGVPPLIDGAEITVPTFRQYNPDGTWFREGHGVDPDIAVDENLGDMAKGIDPQIERAITEIKSMLQTKSYKAPAPPPFEVR
ncbi:S41 family peptidase [Chitinophaga nivalis]|uniref:Tricorn protease homolog n=1 Tax=Chitinophaga nivalis TaxID=2991709 RepID=A0ABT3ILY3_9BACT|nr:S41 family peptidase [Chitinophaga nivalis]MCW3465341.1 PDZ domain-containing protein [Chitinophaga nivalis]MCW3484967.1 PDZ domain-containing protein [Chitinophaga nivalis]